jgi:hypothetical protein
MRSRDSIEWRRSSGISRFWATRWALDSVILGGMIINLSFQNTSFALILIFLSFGLTTTPPQAFGQETATGPSPIQQATNIANATRDWLNGKLSTSGTSGELREVGRSGQKDRPQVTYNIIVKGAPNDQTYTLVSWPIHLAKPREQMKGLSIGRDGLIVCAGRTPEQCVGERKDDPVNLILSPGPGEVFRMALISSDQKTKIFVAAIPLPINTKSGTCSLEVVRLTPGFELALMRARGFPANDDLLFASKSYDESDEKRVKAESDGTYVSALMPYVSGKKSGTTTLSLKGASCESTLSFDWGNSR